MFKQMKWFFLSVVVVLLTACGGSNPVEAQSTEDIAQSIIEEFNTVPLAKVNYEIKQDIIKYSKTDAIQRVDDETTFVAPLSMGFSEGDIFIYDNIAYKISMITAGQITDTVKIFTQKPIVDEVVETLDINGAIPFFVPQIDNSNSFKLKADVTNRTTNQKESVTFTCEVSTEESKPEAVENGFSFGVTCKAVSGNATITITSTETIRGGVLLDYKKGRSKKENTIGFAMNVDVESTLNGNYKVEINNDQDPNRLFRGVAVLGTTPITVAVEYFFLAGITLEGGATYTRTDTYAYKRIYNFDFESIESRESAESTNDLNAEVSVGAYIGIRPMASAGIFGVDIVGLYVDTKMKESITVSGEISKQNSEICVTSKLDLTVQGGYKIIAGDYKLIGSEYVQNLKTDTTDGCKSDFWYNFLAPACRVPADDYFSATNSNKVREKSDLTSVQYATTPDDGLSSELVNQDSYEKILQIDKTGLGDKTISKVTWEVVEGDMQLNILSLESDGSRILLSASDAQGDYAVLKATVKATDGTTISQQTYVSRNSKPVAMPAVYVEGDELVFDASSSYDPDGNPIVIYGWYFPDADKRIINTNPVNKIPLRDLPDVINYKMAVASANQPIEISEVVSKSFTIPSTGEIKTLNWSGNIIFKDSNGNIQPVPANTYVKITPNEEQINESWGGVTAAIDVNGNWQITEVQNSFNVDIAHYTTSNQYQFIVYNNTTYDMYQFYSCSDGYLMLNRISADEPFVSEAVITDFTATIEVSLTGQCIVN